MKFTRPSPPSRVCSLTHRAATLIPSHVPSLEIWFITLPSLRHHQLFLLRSLCANVARLENRCDDLQHCLDEVRASSPLAAASLAVATRIFGGSGKGKRFVGGEDDEGDGEDEEDELEYDDADAAASGPRSLGILETSRSAAQRRRINRTLLAPPTSWEARQKRQTVSCSMSQYYHICA